MTIHVDLYYTMRSPYCYLSTPQLRELVTEYELEFDLKPVYPLAVSWVEFASYTFNTAEGGGTSVSLGRHTVTAGAAYLEPFGINGEIGTGLIGLQPHKDLVQGIELRDQKGFEAYWKILVTPNLWITHGFQYLWDPSFNPTADRLFIPHFKFRLAY